MAASIIKKHPVPSRRPPPGTTLGGVVALTVVLSLIDIALWLGIARACRSGKSWARVTGTVLFAIHTIGVLSVLANSHPGLGPAKVLTLIGWLIGCGAVVFLWQRPSSAFFARGRAPVAMDRVWPCITLGTRRRGFQRADKQVSGGEQELARYAKKDRPTWLTATAG